MNELCAKKEVWEQGILFDLPHDRRPIGECVLQAVKNGSEVEVIPGSGPGRPDTLECPSVLSGGCGRSFPVLPNGEVYGTEQCPHVHAGRTSLLSINS